MKPIKSLITFLCLCSFLLALGHVQVSFVNHEVELGEIQSKKSYDHVFIFENDGDEALKITEIMNACGCTILNYTKTVMPGESGQIKVRYTPKKGEEGFVVKSFTVTFDNGAKQHLYLKATIVK